MSADSTSDSWRASLKAWIGSIWQRGLDAGERLAASGVRKVRDWRREILAAAAPFVLLVVLALVPEIPAVLRSGASIGAIAAVQGAVTGLSLIALVLAVELARRQEDRDDTVYEIMLRTARIRPTFVFALTALLATLTSVAIADFSVFAEDARAANLLLCAYLLTGLVVGALLVTVLRTVHVLRPTGVIEYRFQANDRERRQEVERFVARSLNEVPKMGLIERLLLPHRPVGLTATERLFVEIDDALQSGQAARFSGALQRLRRLIENSADEIAASALGFQPPGRPPLGYWFPLDALEGRLGELWRSTFARQGHEFENELWALQYRLVLTGAERRSGELLEFGLQSGLVGYRAARTVGRSSDHARRVWSNLDYSAWWQLRGADGGGIDPSAALFAARLIEYLQEYGNMLLKVGDMASFRDMLAEFRQSFYDAEEHRWMYQMHLVDKNAPLSNFEYAVMALLALAGRAMTLKKQGNLSEIGEYLAPIHEMVDQFAPIERFVPAACERETPLQQQWSWWETDGEAYGGVRFAWVAPEQYPMLLLLANLLKTGSDQPLPSLGGNAQRFIEAWTSHKGVILEAADVEAENVEELASRFERRLETAKAAEEREREDFHLAAPLDQSRVSQFLERITVERQGDRVLEDCFAREGRVRHLDEAEWGEEDWLGPTWRLPRAPFVDDPSHLPFRGTSLVRGFEYALAFQLTETVMDTSQLHSSVAMELDDVMTAIDAATIAIGEGPQLIVFGGDWPNGVHVDLQMRMYSNTESDLSPYQGQSARMLGTYKRHDMLDMRHEGEPTIIVLRLDRWGWLLRAPMNGEDFKVGLEEIDLDEAARLANEELPDDADEETRAAKIRELRLLVRVRAEERSRFEVEDPAAAWIIRVASSESDDADDEESIPDDARPSSARPSP